MKPFSQDRANRQFQVLAERMETLFIAAKVLEEFQASRELRPSQPASEDPVAKPVRSEEYL